MSLNLSIVCIFPSLFDKSHLVFCQQFQFNQQKIFARSGFLVYLQQAGIRLILRRCRFVSVTYLPVGTFCFEVELAHCNIVHLSSPRTKYFLYHSASSAVEVLVISPLYSFQRNSLIFSFSSPVMSSCTALTKLPISFGSLVINPCSRRCCNAFIHLASVLKLSLNVCHRPLAFSSLPHLSLCTSLNTSETYFPAITGIGC